MEMLSPKKVAVIYLSWLPYGMNLLKEFIHSYKTNPAGYPHQLYVVLNGLNKSENCGQFISEVKTNLPLAQTLELESGQDIDAYFFAAGKVNEEFILFLNSFSKFTRPDWLQLYVKAMESDVGLVGATASFQSLYSTVGFNNSWHWNRNLSVMQNFKKYKLLLKAILYWRFLFPPFPNPHIRTTGFMVRKDVFIVLKKGKLRKKFDAYLFESGKNSLLNQVERKGWRAIIVGRNGHTFNKTNFKESKTFWISEQENTLIIDNQVEYYENCDPKHKIYLRKIAWGA